jgi:predicted lipoprotein with Yx(FWY)xxD motif
MRNRWWVGPGLAAAAVVIAACGSTASPADPASQPPSAAGLANTRVGPAVVKTMQTSKGTVLVNSRGFTLYWFAKDTPAASHCNGSCASYWPPVIGRAVAAAGATLPHGFGTIKRADGQLQATYDGHPLYTYTGDTAAGQLNGNGLNASGGLWWAASPSGAVLASRHAKRRPHPHPSPSSSSGGGGGGW